MKLKTHKATAKRVKVTKGKKYRKLMTKRSGQDHFNARDTGKETRRKRRGKQVDHTNERNIRRLLPYS